MIGQFYAEISVMYTKEPNKWRYNHYAQRYTAVTSCLVAQISRERMISIVPEPMLGVSHRIISATFVSGKTRYYVHHCRFGSCQRVALHTMIKRRSCPVTRRARLSIIHNTGGGWGAGGGMTLQPYTSLSMTPWRHGTGSWPPATDDAVPLQQQAVITTVSIVNHTNFSMT